MTSRRTLTLTFRILGAVLASIFAGLFACDARPASCVAKVLRVESHAPPRRQSEQAIVVLMGGIERTRAAVTLQRATGLPLVLAGGEAGEDTEVLRSGGVSGYFAERASHNTETDAAFTSCAAKRLGIDDVFLVTDELHIWRARAWFWLYGLKATPFPSKVSYVEDAPAKRARELVRDDALHELGGLVEFAARAISLRRVRCDDAAVEWVRLRDPAQRPGSR